MWEILTAVICGIMMLTALAGTILPILPGIPLAWLGLLIYGLGTGFQKISLTTTIVFLVVTLGTIALGYFAPMLGAKKYKASRGGVIGASLGFLIGIFTLGVWGIILGPFLGAIAGELIANKPTGQALQSGVGTLIGFVTGTLLQMVVILVMFGFFLSSLF